MEAEDQDKFFGVVAAYWRRLNDEEKKGWIRWLELSDVTLDVCLKILESLKEQKDKPRLPQFQARFLQRRNVGKYKYDPGCNRCKVRGLSTGWLQGLYGMRAKWDMSYYTGVPIEQRDWNKIWPAVLVDPRDKSEELIHEYYQLHGLPCSCGLGDKVLEREIRADRMPYPRDEHIRISNTMALTDGEAGKIITEFQALAVKKYGEEATIPQTFPGLLEKAGGVTALTEGGFFDDEEVEAVPETAKAPEPRPDVSPEEQNVHWEDLEEIPL